MNDQADHAAVIAPPPLLAALAIAGGLVADHFKRVPIVAGLGRSRFLLSGVLVLVAGALIASGLRQLMTHKEHPSPYKPTTWIVASGIYRFTRNPIYLGFVTVVVATAVGANTAWLLLSAAALLLAFHVGVVRPEERYLSAKFGDDYDNYRRRVRRWI
jgi:protein-S-isoprenylcysteine O-methyltransferase Ste14